MTHGKLFICDCGDPHHQLIFENDEEGFIYVTVYLKPLPWCERLINGIKYIFGFRSVYGDFDEFIFDREDKEQLLEIINKL